MISKWHCHPTKNRTMPLLGIPSTKFLRFPHTPALPSPLSSSSPLSAAPPCPATPTERTSTTTIPNEYTSAACEYFSQRITSGAVNAGVPTAERSCSINVFMLPLFGKCPFSRFDFLSPDPTPSLRFMLFGLMSSALAVIKKLPVFFVPPPEASPRILDKPKSAILQL